MYGECPLPVIGCSLWMTAGGYGAAESMPMPRLSPGSVTRDPGRQLQFQATAGGRPVTLIPIARMHHQHYNVYWLT